MTHRTPARHRTAPGAAMALALLAAATAAAQPPEVATIVSRMKQALEPAQASVRKMTLTVAQGGSTSKVVLGQARGKLADSNRILTVVLEPPELRGTAYLVQEVAANDDNTQWVYVPAIGRVRAVVSPEAFSAFLNSDFTYSDLGFTALHSTYSLLGEEDTPSGHAYRIEAVPPQRWYYSRIVSRVAADSFLPIEREFYDPANQLWKVERFQGVSIVNGLPTVLTVTMDDVQAKSRTTITVTDLQYGARIPEALLQPDGLPGAGKAALWTSLKAPVGH
jgi:outer membrane lipoprotein-sorting protein